LRVLFAFILLHLHVTGFRFCFSEQTLSFLFSQPTFFTFLFAVILLHLQVIGFLICVSEQGLSFLFSQRDFSSLELLFLEEESDLSSSIE